MKTYNNLFQEITSFKNLLKAYKKAKRAKPQTKETLFFSLNLEKSLFSLQKELQTNTYIQSEYREFIILDPKERKIKYLPFKDRVVHHALINIIEPIFEKRFINTTYACRKGKGTHKALEDIKKTVYSNYYSNGYCLKCDIKKYFPSVDKKILKQLILNKIKCKKTLNLINNIIDSNFSDFGKDKGIPIGNLTSQLFSNIYLNDLDHYIKQDLKVKHYFRYVDDFIILDGSKRKLHYYNKKIKNFLKKRFLLEIPKHKSNVFQIKDGVDFVGYKIFPNKVFLRKRNIKKFIKKLKTNAVDDKSTVDNKCRSIIYSYLGYFRYANSFRLVNNVFKKSKISIEDINLYKIYDFVKQQ